MNSTPAGQSFFKAIVLFLLFALPQSTSAQKHYEVKTTKLDITVGKTASGADLMAKEINFPQYIYDLHFDSSRNQMLVVIRKTGNDRFKYKGALVAYDLATREQLWTKELQGDRFDFKTTPEHIVLNSSIETATYDWKDGKRKWVKPGSFVFLDPVNNICLGSGGVALDLNTGLRKWETRIDNKYGWQYLTPLGDTAVLIAAGGVKKINLQNGKGWQYEAKTGADDYTPSGGAVAATAAGIGLGLLTGFMAVPVAGPKLIHGLCSNILLDSNRVYFASREDIVCLDLTGKVIWRTELPKKQTGNSVIWKDHSGVHMLNNAHGYMGYGKVNKGSPYLASFDSKSGRQRYLSELGTFNMVSGTLLNGDTMFIHTINRVYKYNIATGEKLLAVVAADNKLDKHVQFVSDKRIFTKTKDGQYKSLAVLYPQDKFLSGEHNLTRVNEQLQYKGFLTDTLWVQQRKYADMDVLKNKNQMVFVKDGKAVAEFEVSNATIYDDVLVGAHENKLRIIDLKPLKMNSLNP